MSPGWQSNTLQIASNVLKRMAFAFPVFKMDKLDRVKPTFSDSSFRDIFRLAIITSRFTIIGIVYTVNSFSDCNSTPFLKIWAMKKITPAKNSISPYAQFTETGICFSISNLLYASATSANKPAHSAT